MYTMDLDALEEFYKAYENAENQLRTYHEMLCSIAETITEEDLWSGSDAAYFRQNMKNYANGEYEAMVNRLHGIKMILKWAMEEGKSLKTYCDALPEALMSGNFRPGNDDGAEGVLSLNPDLLPVIISSARTIAGELPVIRGLSREVEEIIGELETCRVDVWTDMRKVRESCSRLEHAEYFAGLLGKYAGDMEDWDWQLTQKLSVYSGSTGSYYVFPTGTGPATERLGILLGRKEEGLTAEEGEELQALLLRLYENGELETIQAMTEEIFQKEAEEWSEGEAAFAAGVWSHCIRTADCGETGWYLSLFRTVEYGEPYEACLEGRGAKETVTPVTRFLDTQKSELVLGKLDSFTQGEEYYTLNRIQIFGEDMGKKTYHLRAGQTMEKELVFQVEATEKGMVIQTKVDTPMLVQQKLRITSRDLNAAVGVETMQELGFRKEQITSVLSGVYQDKDMEFAKALCSAKTKEEYQAVFAFPPKELSEAMKAGLSAYGYSLMDNGICQNPEGIVESQDLSRYQEFLNGMLAYDTNREFETVVDAMGLPYTVEVLKPRYCEDYIRILKENAGGAYNLTKEVAAQKYRDGDVKEKAAVMDKQLQQYALYCQLEQLYQTCIPADETYAMGIRIQNLDLDHDTGVTQNGADIHRDSFSFLFEITQGGIPQDGPYKCWMDIKTPQEAMLHDYIQKESDAIVEKEMALPKAAYNVGKTIATCCYPPADWMFSVAEEGAAGGGKAAAGVLKPAAGDNKWAKNSLDLFKSLYSEGYEWLDTQKKFKEMEGTALQPYFRNVVTAQTNLKTQKQEVILLDGMYSSESVLKYARFQEEGCCFLLDGSVDTESIKSEILENKDLPEQMDQHIFKGVSPEDRKNMLLLAWCNEPMEEGCAITIKDMTSGQQAVCLSVIKRLYKDVTDEEIDIYGLLNKYEPY